jgi:hypothetical protein
MKRPDFVVQSVYTKTSLLCLKNVSMIFSSGVKFKFPFKCLGYPAGHRWGAPTLLAQKRSDFLN